MMRIYTSNLYRNANPEPIIIEVYVAPLKKGIAEYTVWKKIKELASSGLAEVYLSVVTHGKLYAGSKIVIDELTDYIAENMSQVIKITNDNEEHSKVIGLLIYRSIDNFFRNRNFKTTRILEDGKEKRVYYKDDDPTFVLNIKEDMATFRAIRGLTPKVYAGNVPGITYLFFVPEGKHFIEAHNWVPFVGEEIKIKRRYLEELEKRNISYSKVFQLKEVKGNNAIVSDKFLNRTIEVPLDEIYIPATTGLLDKFGVFEALQAFTSFKEEDKGITEYKFLEIALGKILPSKEEFTLKVGLTDITFRRIYFGLEEGT